MRYPVDNYKAEWDNHAGYDFGDPTSYGFHDGKDINDNGAGNSDLGKPLFAIAKGKVVGIHQHTGTGNFGNHFFILIEGSWGTRYVHYAHCLELFVTEGQEVAEGYKVASVGNSGTTYAHCHFAIKKKANGMDTVANTKAQLDDAWEDPIAFVEKYIISQPSQPSEPMVTIPQKELDEMINLRNTRYNFIKALCDIYRVGYTDNLADLLERFTRKLTELNNKPPQVVEKEVIKEVPVEKIVEKLVEKLVYIEKIIDKTNFKKLSFIKRFQLLFS